MWLVLASRFDDSALWAATRLRARLSPLRVLSPELLLIGSRWSHRLGARGIETRITLADGTTIGSASLRGVLNRLTTIAPDLFPAAAPDDRLYAAQEAHALVVSMLASLPCPVLNRPGGRGLNGPWCSDVEWSAMASRAGLPVMPRTVDAREAVPGPAPVAVQDAWPGEPRGAILVVGGRCVIAADDRARGLLEPLAPACRRLADGLGLGLLCVTFGRSPHGEPQMVHATPLPDLRLGGEALLEAIFEAFHAAPAGSRWSSPSNPEAEGIAADRTLTQAAPRSAALAREPMP